MSYFAQLQQSVTISSGNSSTSPLDASGTFTGSSQDTLGVAGLQVNLYTNQNCTVYVDQSMEGTNWDIVDTYNYYSSNGGMSWTTQATASYMRVRVTNLSATAAATPFRLQTALCPIVEAVPRTLSEEGNLKVGVYEIEGDFGTRVEVTPMNALKTIQATRLVGSAFSADFDTNFWTKTTNTGTSTSTVTNGVMTLATNPTGSGSGNSAIVNSARTARYTAGASNHFRAQIVCPSSTGALTRRWGAFDASNGYYFKLTETTFSVGSRKGGVDTDVDSGSFNGKQGSTYAVNTSMHTYEISWTNKSVWFSVDSTILHKLTATTAPAVNTPHLKIGLEVTNGANTNNNTLQCIVASIYKNGPLTTQPLSSYISATTTGTVLKYGPGNLHSIVFGSLPTTAGTVTLYDNTAASGTVLYAVAPVKTTQASQVPMSVDFKGLPFYTGLTVVVATNAVPMTVIYE